MNKLRLKIIQKNDKDIQNLIEDFTIWLQNSDYRYSLVQESFIKTDLSKNIGEKEIIKFQDIYDEWRFKEINAKFV